MRFRIVLTLALLAPALTAPEVLAQPTQAEIEASKKAAAEAAYKAVDAYKEGKYEEAIAGFQAADKAFHSPKFLLYVARSQAKLGKLLAAKATYESVASEQLAAYAPKEFFEAQADAKKELAELSGRIPTLRIDVTGVPASQTVTVSSSGESTAVNELGKPLQRDPGRYTIVVRAPGRPQVERVVVLNEGATEAVVIDVPAAPVVTATATAVVAPPVTVTATATVGPAEPTAAPTTTGGPSRSVPVSAYVLYGAGAVGLIAGAVLGGMALGKKGEFDKKPVLETGQAAQGLAVGADIVFSLALIGAVAGTVVWLKAPDDPIPGKSTAGSARSVYVAPRVGGLTLGGTF